MIKGSKILRGQDYWPIFAFGAITLIMGLTVIGGWYTQSEALIQIHPSFVPMQFNTALGMALIGAGILLRTAGHAKLAVGLGSLSALLGGLTLVQYIGGVDFQIDQLFMDHYITVKTSHPGRMAPNTAFCFFLTGCSLMLFLPAKRKVLATLARGILGAIVIALGGVAFCGYLIGVEAAYGWAHLTRMAVHTSFGFIIAGAAIFLLEWNRVKSRAKTRAPLLVWTTFIAGLTVTSALYQTFTSIEERHFKRSTELTFFQLQGEFRQLVEPKIKALQRMAERWQVRQRPTRLEWEVDAGNYIKDEPAHQAIEWIDRNKIVQWVVPKKGNETVPGANFGVDTERARTLTAARTSRAITITDIINLTQGGKGFLVVAPIFIREEFDGYLVAVFRLDRLLSPLRDEMHDAGFSFVVRKDGEEIYRSRENLNTSGRRLLSSGDFPVGSHLWQGEIWPDEATISSWENGLPVVILVAGFMLSVASAARVGAGESARSAAEQLRQLNEKLSLADEQHRIILGELADAALAIDTDGKIQYANPATEKMFGWTENELMGQNVKILTPQPVNDQHDGYIKNYLQTGDAKIIGKGREVTALKKNGEVFPAHLDVSEARLKGGFVFIGLIRDLTVQKEAEVMRYLHAKEQEALNRKLERSNQDLEQFAYVASHDLRAPLRGMKTAATWLAEDLDDIMDEDSRENLTLLQNRATRLENLLEGLLHYSRVSTQKSELESVDVKKLLDDIILLIAPPASFQIEVSGEMPVLQTAEIHLHQVFQNLIENAIKHHDRAEGHIVISAEEKEQVIKFEVRDDGPGIAPEFHGKVMEIFQTLHRRDEKEASGMGLALVKRIIERHGGELHIESPLTDRGCAMQFTWIKNEGPDHGA